MSRLRLHLGVSAVALLGVAGFALSLWLTSPTPGVTWDSFRRLRKGMSTAEVEALLGGRNEVSAWGVEGFTSRLWQDEEVEISLVFDADRLWKGGAFCLRTGHRENIQPEDRLFDRIRRLLHLTPARWGIGKANPSMAAVC